MAKPVSSEESTSDERASDDSESDSVPVNPTQAKTANGAMPSASKESKKAGAKPTAAVESESSSNEEEDSESGEESEDDSDSESQSEKQTAKPAVSTDGGVGRDQGSGVGDREGMVVRYC